MKVIRTFYASSPVYWSTLGRNRYAAKLNIQLILRAYLLFLIDALFINDLCTYQYKSTFSEN